MDKEITTNTTVLTRKDLLKTWWRWICWAQRCYNYERLMGLGFCQAISNVIEKLYPKKEDRAETLTRHMRFYNTENNWGAMILGVTCALEEERATGHEVDPSVIDNMKSALMGPLAGIGDSISQSIVKVILLGISIDLATKGNLLGPIFYILGFSAYALIVSYTTFFSGYKMGRGAVTKLLASNTAKSMTGALKIVSMIVIGALAAGNIKAKTIIQGTIGGSAVVLQDVLDKILPKMIPLAILVLVIYLLKKKQKSSIFVLLVLFAIGLILTFLNILA
jgi:mannose/fructose/N-acetylgalactosamine-specific phosphotransferase system component IID